MACLCIELLDVAGEVGCCMKLGEDIPIVEGIPSFGYWGMRTCESCQKGQYFGTIISLKVNNLQGATQ